MGFDRERGRILRSLPPCQVHDIQSNRVLVKGSYVITRARSLLRPAVVAVLLVLTLGSTALPASDAAAASVRIAAATPGCGKAPR